MIGNFSFDEISDLIAEAGHFVELGIPVITTPAQPDFSIPARTSLSYRRVEGYVYEDSQQEIALASAGATEKGRPKIILSARTVSRIELNNPEARIRVLGRAYQFQYIKEHVDRGVIRMHELALF